MSKALTLPRPKLSRVLPLACSLAFAIVLSGCGGSSSGANSVTGKVTYKNGPVSGLVVFVYGDSKEVSAPIQPDGSYNMVNPPPGQVKIVIKPMPGGTGGVTPKAGAPMKDAPSSEGNQNPPPPLKYQNQASSTLTFEVKTGKQPHDIPLD